MKVNRARVKSNGVQYGLAYICSRCDYNGRCPLRFTAKQRTKSIFSMPTSIKEIAKRLDFPFKISSRKSLKI